LARPQSKRAPPDCKTHEKRVFEYGEMFSLFPALREQRLFFAKEKTRQVLSEFGQNGWVGAWIERQ
jgi:hypothetical protein